MRRSLTFLVLIFAAMCAYAAEGDFFYFDRVQYQVKKSDAQQNLYTVAIVRYDTSCVIVPDSVPYNGQKYQVVQIPDFRSGSYSVQHYTKVDFSRVQNTFTDCSFKTASSIEVDTLILPPKCSSYSVTRYQATHAGIIPQGGVHRIFCTGPSMPQGNKPFGVELREFNMRNSTDTALSMVFQGCSSLQKVVLPSTLKLFQEHLFEGDSSLFELTIPESLEVIEQDAFGNHQFDLLSLGSEVRKLQPGFCAKWYNLRRIDVASDNLYYKSDEEGVLFSSNEKTILRYPMGKKDTVYFVPNEVDTIGMQAFALQTPRENHYRGDTVQDWFEGYPTDVYNVPYQIEAPLHEVVIHPNVRMIDKDAFMASSIRKMSSGEDPKELHDLSFSNVRHIGSGAFIGSMLDSISLPSSLLTLGSNENVLNRYWHKDDLPYFDSEEYNYTYDILQEYGMSWNDLPWPVKWFEEQKFPGLHTYLVSGGFVFAYCKHLQSIDFSQCKQLKYMGRSTFAECHALQSIDLSPCDSLRAIHDRMFSYDLTLTYVHLPYRVDTIDPYAFYNCVLLNRIVCPAPLPIPIHHSVFDGVNRQNCTLAVPDAFIPLYQAAPIWQDFNIVGNGLTGIAVMSSDRSMGVARGSAGLHIGDSTVISATPLMGYEFIGWSDGVTANPRTVTVTRDSSIVAIFQPIEYLIDAHSNDTTLGTVSGAGYYHLNDTVILSVNILDDARFTGWSDGFRYPVRDLVVTRDCTLIANFEHYHIGPDAVHVTVQSEDSSKGTTVGSGTYPLGDTASVAGIANAGYVFKGWDDGNINNPRHVPLTQDTLFVALFRLATDTADTMATPRYHLKAIPYDSTMGSVSGSGRYEEGTVVEITATPFEGYRITGWNIELTVEPTLIFTMPDRPVTIIAYFEPIDDALPAMPADPDSSDPSDIPYNILGQPVDDTYHGIVIRNGKKVLQ